MSLINFIASSVYMCAENCANFYFCNGLSIYLSIYRRLKRSQLGGHDATSTMNSLIFSAILSNQESQWISLRESGYRC